MSLFHFRKELSAPPVAAEVAGITVRQLLPPDDIHTWLTLRERAMAGQAPAVRAWTEADFRREFVDKPWWRAEHAWVAAVSRTTNDDGSLIGAVFLGLREGQSSAVPVVHWLLVDPEFRRRGIGRTLMLRLEYATWDAGWREVQVESHIGWEAAIAFYQSIGYAPVRERSPR